MTLNPVTAKSLVEMQLPEPRQLIPGLITEGLNILAGNPKSGKSWLAMGMSLALTSGRKVLGQIEVTQPTGVLYLALEDTLYRLKARVLGLKYEATDLMRFTTSLPRLGAGGLAALDEYLSDHPEVGMVVIDTLAKVADAKTGNNVYEEDAALGGALHALAHHHGVALVVVHHTRKQAHGDFLHMVSGSAGFTGTADTVLVLTRQRNDSKATLEITGRDVREAKHDLFWSMRRGGWVLEPNYDTRDVGRGPNFRSAYP